MEDGCEPGPVLFLTLSPSGECDEGGLLRDHLRVPGWISDRKSSRRRPGNDDTQVRKPMQKSD